LAYKQVFPALQALTRRGLLEMPVIGIARSDWTLAQLRERARHSLQQHGGGDEAAFERLCARLLYIGGGYHEPRTFERLRAGPVGTQRPLHYLATPPSLFAAVIGGLAAVGCTSNARVIVEKPFGRDLASAQALNRSLHQRFDETAV